MQLEPCCPDCEELERECKCSVAVRFGRLCDKYKREREENIKLAKTSKARIRQLEDCIEMLIDEASNDGKNIWLDADVWAEATMDEMILSTVPETTEKDD